MTTWPKAPPLDDGGVELALLDDDSCWDRLRSVPVGRVAVAGDDGTILVLPVNFVVEDRTIVFRTAPGATLDHLHRGSVTFQADAVDPFRRLGWSVLVHGHAAVAVEPCDQDRVPATWAGGHRRHVVRVRAARITGRELCPVQPDWDQRGYL